MGQKPTDEEVFNLIALVDDNMSNTIDFPEFLKVRHMCHPPSCTKGRLLFLCYRIRLSRFRSRKPKMSMMKATFVRPRNTRAHTSSAYIHTEHENRQITANRHTFILPSGKGESVNFNKMSHAYIWLPQWTRTWHAAARRIRAGMCTETHL